MKKILSTLATVSIVTSSTANVIACGRPKEEKDVVFMLELKASGRSGKLEKSFSSIVKKFNEKRNNDINVIFKTSLENKIASDIISKNNLPDLYIGFPDSLIKYIEKVPNKVRNFDDIKKPKYISESFLQEGIFGGHQYLLPLAKSVDVSVVNLRLVKEVLAKFGIIVNLTKTDSQTEITASKVFSDPDFNKDNYKEIKTELTKSFNIVSSNQDLQNKLLNTKNTLILAEAYFYLYSNNKLDKGLKDSDYFALAYDDIANKINGEYASILSDEGMTNSQIKVSGKSDNEQKYMYSFNKNSSNKYILDVFTKPGSQQTKGLKNVFETLEKLRTLGGKPLATDYSVWNGKVYIQRLINGKKVYGSDFFKKGTIMISTTKSAGLWAYVSLKGTDQDLKIESNDLLITSSENEACKEYYAQKNPSIGSFKSSNITKQKVANNFIEFMFQPEVLAKFGSDTGYLPVTQDAIAQDTYQKAIVKDKELLQLIDIIKNKPKTLFTIEVNPLGIPVTEDIIQDIIQNYMYESGKKIDLDTFFNGVNGKNGAKEKWEKIATDYNKKLVPNFK